MRFLVMLADDGEGAEDISGIVAGQAVEMEEQGIEPCRAVAAVNRGGEVSIAPGAEDGGCAVVGVDGAEFLGAEDAPADVMDALDERRGPRIGNILCSRLAGPGQALW